MVEEGASHVASERLTPEERREGYRRLAVAAAIVVGLALLIALLFVALGADLASGLGAGFGMVGILLVIGGVVAFSRTSSVRRTRGEFRHATVAERKAAERMALGFLAGGIACSVLALVVG